MMQYKHESRLVSKLPVDPIIHVVCQLLSPFVHSTLGPLFFIGAGPDSFFGDLARRRYLLSTLGSHLLWCRPHIVFSALGPIVFSAAGPTPVRAALALGWPQIFFSTLGPCCFVDAGPAFYFRRRADGPTVVFSTLGPARCHQT
jgi:hypothetical protein